MKHKKLIGICTFIILLIITMLSVNAEIELSKQTYQVGEKISVRLDYETLNDKTLQVQSGGRLYTYQGELQNIIPYMPEHEGRHEIIVKNTFGQALDTKIFEVTKTSGNIDQNLSSEKTTISDTILPKENYALGEIVLMNLENIDYNRIKIQSQENVFSFLGQDKNVKFQPPSPGTYEIIIFTNKENIIQEFEVEGTVAPIRERPVREFSTQVIAMSENNSELNMTTNLTLYHEMPDTITTGKEFPVRVIIEAELNDVHNITIYEDIPKGWNVVELDNQTALYGDVLVRQIPLLEKGEIQTFIYKLRATGQEQTANFTAEAQYISNLQIMQKIYKDQVFVTNNGTYFDVDIDFYDKDNVVTREVKAGILYKSELILQNLGKEVTKYPTYVDLEYNPSLTDINPINKECKIIVSDKTVMRCAFQEMLEGENKTVRFHFKTNTEGTLLFNTLTRYDPPKSFIQIILDFFKNLFGGLYESMKGGITGNVVNEQSIAAQTSQDSDVETREEPEQPVNLPPRIYLESLPNKASGEIIIDASKTIDFEDDALRYTFLISPTGDFATKEVVCQGTKSTCNWNTSSSICSKCYVQVQVTDGQSSAYSEIFKVQIEKQIPAKEKQDNKTQENKTEERERRGGGGGRDPDPIDYDPFKDPDKHWIETREKIYLKSEAGNKKTISIKDSNNTPKLQSAAVLWESKKSTDLRLNFSQTSKIRQIDLFGVKQNQTLELGVEEEFENSALLAREGLNTFALDPTRMNFTKAEVTTTAVGKQLWKCKEYNFTEKRCYGQWKRVMDIVPGQEYTFNLTPEDPLYSEINDTLVCSCTDSADNQNSGDLSCSNYCEVGINVPSNAETAYLTEIVYDVTITISADGTTISNSRHDSFFDHDQTIDNGDEVSIGSSTTTTTITTTFTTSNMDSSGSQSFNNLDCDNWPDTCTYYAYINGSYHFQAPGRSRRSPSYTYTLNSVNYTWNYTEPGDLTVELNNPELDSYTNDGNITFNYTPTSSTTITNCSLYTDYSSWGIRDTNYSIDNGTFNYISHEVTTTGQVIWNVRCIDGNDNDVFAPSNYTFTIDKTSPATYLETPADEDTWTSSSVVTFEYNVSDSSGVDNCTLIVDGEGVKDDDSITIDTTQSFEHNLDDGTHIWSVACTDLAGNTNISSSRTINVSVPPTIWDGYWYESHTSACSPTSGSPCDISLLNSTDGTQNSISYTLNSGESYTMVNALSEYISNNGGLINSGSTISFNAYFSTGNGNVEVRWKLYNQSSSGTSLICEDSTWYATSNAVTVTGSCTTSSDYYISPTSKLLLEILTRNTHPAQSRSATHEVDHTNSYVYIPWINLGTLSINMSQPNSSVSITQGETFNLTCNVDCDSTGFGTCQNTMLYAQYNTSSTGWTNISSSGNLVLGSGETNPYNMGNLTAQTSSYTFIINGSQASTNNVRCYAEADYVDGAATGTEQVTVGDAQAPNVTLASPENDYWNNTGNISFSYSVSDSSTVDCELLIDNNVNDTLNGLSSGQYTFNVTSFTEGTRNWTVNCTDTTGLTGTDTARNFTIDLTKPDIQLNFPGIDEVVAYDTINFNWTVTDNMAANMSCDLYIDGSPNVTGINSLDGQATNHSVPDFSVGTHNWSVSCTDYANNNNQTAYRYFNVTDNPPTVALDSPYDGYWHNETDITLYFNASDNNQLQNCSLYINDQYNDTKYAAELNNGGLSNFSLTGLQQTSYNWSVTCFDDADYSDTTTEWWFDIDVEDPVVTLDLPVAGTQINTSTTFFNWTVTDNRDNNLACNLTIDDFVYNTNVVSGGEGSYNYPNNIDGLHYWNVTCYDNSQNQNLSETRNYTTLSKPSINLGNPANGSSEKNPVTFYYTPNDNDGFTNCSLLIDGSVNATNNTINNGVQNNFTYTFASEGYYNWSVECYDNGTFVNYNQSLENNLLIDNSPPNITLNFPDNHTQVNNSYVNFNWTAEDVFDSNLTCDLYVNDQENVTGINSPSGQPTNHTVTNFTNANYNWSMYCYDDAGNNQTSGINYFNVSVPPTITLDDPEQDYWSNESLMYFWYIPDGNDDIVNCSLYINDQWNQTNSSIDQGNLNYFYTEGFLESDYNWSVSCIDNGSLTGTSETRDLYFDFGYPWIELHNPLPNETLETNNVTFNFTGYDARSPNVSCNLSIYDSGGLFDTVSNITAPANNPYQEYYLLGDGNYSWNMTCQDLAGNLNYSETRNFSIYAPPNVELVSPDNNSWNQSQDYNFTYIPEDQYGIRNCTLYVDGAVEDNQSSGDITLNSENIMGPVNGLVQGLHNWTVNCIDFDYNSYTAPPYFFTVDYTEPAIDLIYPTPYMNSTTSTIDFTYNMTDNLAEELTCDLNINDTTYDSSIISLTNGVGSKTVQITDLNDSSYSWNVNCTDQAYNKNTSNTEYFEVKEPPSITLGDPVPDYRTSNTSMIHYYTPTDNSGAIASCELIINGEVNQTNSSVDESQENNFTIPSLAHGEYNWSVNCTDYSGYEGNSTTKTYNIDVLGPTIELLNPTEGQTFNYEEIYFNWTATDFPGTDVTCNLTISEDPLDVTVNNITQLSGTTFEHLENLSYGLHYWNVTCVDDLGNTNFSENRNFTINQPDLYINNSMLAFNNSNPDLYENITIRANVTNIGGNPASNVLVEFWDGLPDIGIYLGNQTADIVVNATISFNTSFNATPGLHEIWAVVDPDNNIAELDENNNNATRNISVLRSTINSPENNTWINNETFELNFTLQDYLGGTINYTIIEDGSPNGQTGTVNDNQSKLLNVTFASEGPHTVIVRATDDLGRTKDSESLTITYDSTQPEPNFEVLNGTFFYDTTPQIDFNITDNLASTLNYTLYVDGLQDGNGTVSEGTSTAINLSALGEGRYNITLEGRDQADNLKNNSIIIFVDQTDPAITLWAPEDNANLTSKETSLNFSATDNLDTSLLCNVTLDGSVINQSISLANNTNHSVALTNLTEGTHNWNVTCWDGLNNQNIVNINTSETRSFNVFSPPNVTLTSPFDNYWSSNPQQTFYFNATDETGLENCSILLDGEVNDTKTTAELVNGGTNNFTVSNMNGSYEWAVECYDNTTYNSYYKTDNRSINIDLEAPYPYIQTANETWFNTATPLIDFNITDNMDLVLNYTFYVDQQADTNGSVNNGTPDTANLQPLTNGTHEVLLEAFDEALNYRNSTPITIYVDTVAPSIQLHYPEPGNITRNSSVYFNWTATDNLASTLECALTVDETVETTVNVSNGTAWNETLILSSGLHYWNITCTDLASNTNYSETRNFTVPAPDIYIESSYIQFNDTNPAENKTITINATVENIGNTNAGSFTVQFFKGDPDSGGAQINGNQTISGLVAGENATVNVSYNPVIGVNNIYVRADVPFSTNGSVTEENESNNEANKSFTIEQFHIVAGSTVDDLSIRDVTYKKLFDWSVTNLTGSNVFVSDTDSNIDWEQLQAIGRNITNQTTSDDFEEIDIALGSSNYEDSINNTYTQGGSPKLTRTFEVRSSIIANVAIVNSTNTSNFVTGILWDTGDGNNEYNGTQDLLFLTEVNQNQTGGYGQYDYEIKIPAPLRSYKGSTNSVSFYTEIK